VSTCVIVLEIYVAVYVLNLNILCKIVYIYDNVNKYEKYCIILVRGFM
jgi:hypothetical protein